MNVAKHPAGQTKKATNLSLDAALLSEARALGINISRACEAGLAQNVAEVRSVRWIAENAEAIAASNAYVERHGLPLESYRSF